LVVIGKNSGGGCEFKAASNANKQNAQNIFKIINEDLKPKVEAM
jgi:hypothetical protein